MKENMPPRQNMIAFDDEFESGDTQGRGCGIEFEVKKISNKEEELMKKARDLENEMRQIR